MPEPGSHSSQPQQIGSSGPQSRARGQITSELAFMTEQIRTGHCRRSSSSPGPGFTAELQPEKPQLLLGQDTKLPSAPTGICQPSFLFFFPFSPRLSLKNISGAILLKMQMLYTCKAFVINFKTTWTFFLFHFGEASSEPSVFCRTGVTAPAQAEGLPNP